MKILVVHNRYRTAQPSGENAVVAEEAELLAQRGHEVERLEVESDSIAHLPLARKALLPVQVVWSRSGAQLVRARIAASQPDVVHFHNTFPLLSPAAIRSATSTATSVVLTMHNFRPLCAAGTFLRAGRVCEECLTSRAPFAALRYGCYRDSRVASIPLVAMSAVHRRLGTWTDDVDAILFPSCFARDKYLAAGWPAAKLHVKYNTARATTPVRRGPGSGFVAVSRLSGEKGIDVLIEAWRAAFPDGGDTLTIVGSGDDAEALRRRAAGVKGIEFVGALPPQEARQLLSQTRALVVPSRCYEVFPRTIAEAFSAGVPVIASRIGALAEVVEHGTSGLLVESESVTELASALVRLSGEETLAGTLGAGARAAYDSTFSPERTTDALESIYAGALTASPVPR